MESLGGLLIFVALILAAKAASYGALLTVEVRSGAELAAAYANHDVIQILLPSGLRLKDEDFEGYELPIVIRRNLTIKGSAVRPSIVDMNYLKNKVRLSHGVHGVLRHVVLLRLRAGSITQAPGLDILAPAVPGEVAFMVMDASYTIPGVCFPVDVLNGLTSAFVPQRPPDIPGVSSWEFPAPLPPNCTNDTAAHPLDRCYQYGALYRDFAVYGADIQPSGLSSRNGYVISLTNVMALCPEVLPADCMARLGLAGCSIYYLATSLPATDDAAGTSPVVVTGTQPPALAGGGSAAGQDGGGDGGGPDTAVLIGAVLGGVAAATLAAAAAALLLLRRRRRLGGADKALRRSDGSGTAAGDDGSAACALSMEDGLEWASSSAAGTAAAAAAAAQRQRQQQVATPTDYTATRTTGVASGVSGAGSSGTTGTDSGTGSSGTGTVELVSDLAPSASSRGTGSSAPAASPQLRTAASPLPGLVRPDTAKAAPSPTPATPPLAGPSRVASSFGTGWDGGGGSGRRGSVPSHCHPAVEVLSPLTPQRPDLAIDAELVLSEVGGGGGGLGSSGETQGGGGGGGGGGGVCRGVMEAVSPAVEGGNAAARMDSAAVVATAAAVAAVTAAGAVAGRPLADVADSDGGPGSGSSADCGSGGCADSNGSGGVEVGSNQVTLLPTLLGRGGFGRVYLGIYQGQRVAVKIIHYQPAALAAEAAAIAGGTAVLKKQRQQLQGAAAPLPFPDQQEPGQKYQLQQGQGGQGQPEEQQQGLRHAQQQEGQEEQGQQQQQQEQQQQQGGQQRGQQGGQQGGQGQQEQQQHQEQEQGAQQEGKQQQQEQPQERLVCPLPAAPQQGHGGGQEGAREGGRAGQVVSTVAEEAEEDLTGLHSFKQEVQVLGRCCHPNVVRLLAVCLTPPRLSLVMEAMESSLERLVYGGGGLMPLHKVLHIALQIARGLEYLHPAVVHRDLKPANVLLNSSDSDRPVVKLADFGLSRIRLATQATLHPEAGTPAYMPPECFDTSNRLVKHHADIYSFGVVLWVMLTGEEPWKDLSMVAIAVQVTLLRRQLVVHNLPEERCPHKLQRLLWRCFEYVPQRRPAAADLVKELLLVQEELQRREAAAAAAAAAAAEAAAEAAVGVAAAGPTSLAEAAEAAEVTVLLMPAPVPAVLAAGPGTGAGTGTAAPEELYASAAASN